MENKICLDTDFLVNFLRNKKSEKQFIHELEHHVLFATTTINLFEIYHGAFKSKNNIKNLNAIKILKKSLIILSLNEDIAKDAAKTLTELEKKGKPIDFRDLFIGSIAKHHNFAVKTNNEKHFSRINGISLV